jgi:hypothetical protein
MNTALAKKSVQVEIAERVSRGDLTSGEQIAEEYGVTYQQAIGLFTNPNFTALVAGISKATAKLAWHGKVIPKIIKMLDNDDPKIQLQAMNLLGKITDSIKGSDFNISINLENMVRQFSDQDEKSKTSNNLNEAVMEAEYKRILNED